jgi:hypothetical protein
MVNSMIVKYMLPQWKQKDIKTRIGNMLKSKRDGNEENEATRAMLNEIGPFIPQVKLYL